MADRVDRPDRKALRAVTRRISPHETFVGTGLTKHASLWRDHLTISIKPSTTIALLPLLANIGTLAAPQADRLNDLTRHKTTGRVPPATEFSCEGDLTWITSCQSKTAACSCFLAIQQVCDGVATDRKNRPAAAPASSRTCSANVATNNVTILLYDDCFNALQAINNGCVTPGERPNPHDNLPTMRGWQNTDPGNETCGGNVDPDFPSYDLASGNYIGKWGEACGGQNRFGSFVSVAAGGDDGGGVAPGGSHGSMPATSGAGAPSGQYGNINPERS